MILSARDVALADPGDAASVVVCTYRHGADLVDALASVAGQMREHDELVLVRSGTTADRDLPDDVAAWIESSKVTVQAVFEPRPGVALARDLGLATSVHDIVLFLDDDAVAWPGWRDGLVAAISAGAAAAGGSIIPKWPAGRRPGWLPSRLGTYYGERLVEPRLRHRPFGANLAVRRELAERAGGFRIDLGHAGSAFGLHEETELCDRLAMIGYRVDDVAEAIVWHQVRPDQVRVTWLLRRAWSEGRADAIVRPPGRPSVRAGKLAGLIACLPFSVAHPPTALYLTSRILVNVGYFWQTSLTRSLRRRSSATP